MTGRPQNAFFSDFSPPRYFSIDSGRPFLKDLAEGLVAAFGEELVRAEIYVPTRRAGRGLGDALLSARMKSGASAALLPRIRAIGDIDEDELAVFAGDAEDELNLPPAISATARLLALARLVAAKERSFAGQENWPAALAAARELGRLLDSLYAEEIDPARLDQINVGERAKHWDVSAAFLKIVSTAWPAYLDEIGLSDPAWRRAQLIGAKARRMAATPPEHPILIAGTTASAPAVARLVAAIAAAPLGAAILPGLDRDLDDGGYAAIEDAHPQFGLKQLLEDIGRSPSDIAPWPGSGNANPRAALLRLALRPADATDEWLALIGKAAAADPALEASRNGFTLIEAETEDAEAAIIAMHFRETLEMQGASAMLVTPDRNLARRVALKMQRWNVIVDDSGGVPLANTPCGAFLRLTAGFLEDPDDPVAVLAMLRHPLAGLGLDDATRRRGVDALDRALRGPRKPNAIAAVVDEARRGAEPNEPLTAVGAVLSDAAERYRSAIGGAFAGMMRAHLECAETLAGSGALWSGEDGAAGAELLADLMAEEATLNAVRGAHYREVFDALIAGEVVRRRSEAHPRLTILGPLEARLMSADHVILGGLNEGVWPQVAPADPFLSRAMRKTLGLPSLERRIGLAAHDFAQGAASPRVTLTRAERAGGAPAKPSRWVVRLRNILDGAGAIAFVDQSELWRARAAALDDAGVAKPIDPPRPRAGPDRRPQALSVTQVETWIRDPYAIYARHILKLRKLDDPGEEPDARAVGSLIHRIFERAASAPAPLPAAALRDILDEEAPRYGLGGGERAFLTASLDKALEWFAAFDAERRREGVAIVERQGSLTLPGVEPPFTLTARADRIEIAPNGEACIIDFKTGAPPTDDQEKANFSPQLPLTGLIVAAGGFEGVPAAQIAAYSYIRSLNRSDDEKKNTFGREGEAARAAVAAADAGLRAWVARFDDPRAVYLSQPRPQFVKYEGDYDQLARRREWMASDDAEGGAE
jgi:ATP-dependent helicase/nuclease subunit B